MIFSEINAYGWGTSKIAMPRATLELRPQRRRQAGALVLPGRPDGGACRWRSLPISGIFLVDCPWRQFLCLAMLSAMIIAYLYLLNLMLPGYQTEQRSKPVEIVVALQKPEVIPDEQRPVIATAAVNVTKEAVLEPDSEAPRNPVPEKPEEKTPEVSKKLPTEPKISPVKVKSRVLPEKTREPRRIASIAPDITKPLKPVKINIPPPTVRKRSYAKRDSEKILQPHQMSKTTHFSAATNTKFSEDIDVGGLRYFSKRYPLLAETQTATSDTQPAVSFQAPKSIKIGNPKLEKPKRQTAQALPSAPAETAQDFAFTSSRPAGTQLSVVARADRQYTITKIDQPQVPSAASPNREINFQSQKQKKSLKLPPPVSNKLIGKADSSVTDDSDAIPKEPDFSASVAPAEVDAEDLISLQAFNVCKDPQREFRQKTQLAVHLLHATRVESEGVIFFIRYTESAYTIEIHIYNPHGRPFKNRCEVLELALKSLVNRAN